MDPAPVGDLETAKLVLEYLKALVSAPPIIGLTVILGLCVLRKPLVALINRVASIRFPGGAEVFAGQQKVESKPEASELPTPAVADANLPTTLTPEQVTTIQGIIKAERVTGRLWEYRYLNYFLVRQTQEVLDWFSKFTETMTYTLYDAFWTPHIPNANDRHATITALQAHHLILTTGDVITVTDKGREYLNWRGPLPDLKPVV